MALDLEAELEAAQQAYLDNAGWRSGNDSAKALLFCEACDKLLILIPAAHRSAGRFEMRFDVNLNEIARARGQAGQFLDLYGVIATPVQFSFEELR